MNKRRGKLKGEGAVVPATDARAWTWGGDCGGGERD